MPLIALPPPYFINEIKVNGHKLNIEEPQDRKTSWKSRWEYSIKPTRFFLDRNPEVPGTGIAIPDDNKH